MDFSTVEAVTIPEGEVVKITSGSTVLWEKVNSYMVYITGGSAMGASARITVALDGTDYTVNSSFTYSSIKVVDRTIKFSFKRTPTMEITINGSSVSIPSSGYIEYTISESTTKVSITCSGEVYTQTSYYNITVIES